MGVAVGEGVAEPFGESGPFDPHPSDEARSRIASGVTCRPRVI
jgi:hypothetical protein